MGYTKITRELDDRPIETINLEFDLPSDLLSGNHTEIIKGYDGTNLVKTVTRNFNIEASVIYEAETTTYMNAMAIPNNGDASIYTITNSQLWGAVNNLVLELKAESLFNIIVRLYLKLGSIASKQSINLKDVNANGTFFGGWVHDETGSIANGVNSYFNSKVSLNELFGGNGNNGIIQVVNDLQLGSNQYQASIGARETSNAQTLLYLGFNYSIDQVAPYVKQGLGASANGIGKGVHALVLQGAIGKHFKNGVLEKSGTVSGNNPTAIIYEGSRNLLGSADSYFKGTIGSSVYAGDITDVQAAKIYNALDTFESAIGRKKY